jgi:hypothetical protein
VKTHCKRGDPMEGKNLLMHWRGKYLVRVCRRCKAIRDQRRRSSMRQKAESVEKESESVENGAEGA